MKKGVTAVLLAIFLSAVTASFSHAATYQIHDLGTLPGGASSWAFDINNACQIAGWSTASGSATHRAVLWSIPIDYPGWPIGATDMGTGECRSVNMLSQGAGYDGNKGYYFAAGSSPVDLVSPQGSAATYKAYGINNIGQVVGYSQTTSNTRGVLWTVENGTVASRVQLSTPYGYKTYARAINNSGLIAGYSTDASNNPCAAYWSSDASHTLTHLSGGTKSHAYAVNDNGWMAGDAMVGSTYKATRWDANGSVTYLNILPGKTGSYYANDINNNNQVAGYCGNRAVVWDSTGTPIDLGTLPGGGESQAHGINDSGWIVGYAYDSSGFQRAVLWVPVIIIGPPPSPIGKVKTYVDGIRVVVEDAVVTAVNLEPGVSYVQSLEPSSGIKLLTTEALTKGQRVKFNGIVRKIDGEWLIDDILFTEKTGGSELSPVMMTSRSISSYIGINTTGLLVRTCGTVTKVIAAENVIYVDDGGGYTDGLSGGSPSSPNIGIRVKLPSGVTLPEWNQKVAVSGISRVEKITLTGGGIVYAPAIWVRGAEDIQEF